MACTQVLVCCQTESALGGVERQVAGYHVDQVQPMGAAGRSAELDREYSVICACLSCGCVPCASRR